MTRFEILNLVAADVRRRILVKTDGIRLLKSVATRFSTSLAVNFQLSFLSWIVGGKTFKSTPDSSSKITLIVWKRSVRH